MSPMLESSSFWYWEYRIMLVNWEIMQMCSMLVSYFFLYAEMYININILENEIPKDCLHIIGLG